MSINDEYAVRMGQIGRTPPAAPVVTRPPGPTMAEVEDDLNRDIQRRADEATARNQLQVQPPQPAEPVVTLSDGSQPLPLGTVPSNKHTTEQLKDWLARTRKAAQSQ